MSNIPRARAILEEVIADTNSKYITERLTEALGHMTRDKAVKRAPAKRVRITAAMRKEIKSLARKNWSHADIAYRVGLRNGGRVSEILNGKR